MKAGKALEQLVVAIQEYIKNNPDTQITPNAKLLDNTGLEREIDVFVQTMAQGGKVGIAFECKDYRDKVDVKEVEAFNSKSIDIREIHKRIIVSSNGFTSGAQTKAKFYGIELYQIGEVPLNEILTPFDIFYTQSWVEMDRYCCQVIVENVNSPILYSEISVFYYKDNKEVEILEYLITILRSHLSYLLPATHNFLHAQRKTQGNIPITITPPDRMYALDLQGNKHLIKEFQVTVRVTLNEQLQKIAKQLLYAGQTEETPMVRISEYKRDEGIDLLLVHGKGNTYSAFLKDAEGKLKETHLISIRKPAIL